MSYMKQFQLLKYADALAASRVININELGTYIWVQIPNNLSPYVVLTDVQDMGVTPAASLEFAEKITRDNRNCWMKIDLTLLSTEIGFHVYKFVFNDTITSEDIPLYFAYNLQNDAPDRPYIYIDRSEKT